MNNDERDVQSQIFIGLVNLIGVSETRGATQASYLQGALNNLVPAALTLLTLPHGPSDPHSMPGPGGH